jgi:primary-amine oxidase
VLSRPLPQDGTVSYEIKLTGELSTNMLSPGEDMPEHGTLVGEGINAQHHQHMFCARLDPAVDDRQGGKGLVVTEVSGDWLSWWLACAPALELLGHVL